MSENLQKGWLKTREGEKFAPATLVENVYTRSGKPYDTRVREYVDEIRKELASSDAITDLEERTTALETKTEDISTEYDDALYVTDSQSNIIAYIDQSGVHSINYTNRDGEDFNNIVARVASHAAEIQKLSTKTEAFDASLEDDTLYVVDLSDNIIAQIDSTGVTSINFKTKATDDFNTIAARKGFSLIKVNETDVAASSSQDTVNLAAGDHIELAANNKTITFSVPVDSALNSASSNPIENKVVATKIETTTEDIAKIKAQLTWFNGEASDKLLVIDDADNVIAYIDASGVHSLDLIAESKDEGTVATLRGTADELHNLKYAASAQRGGAASSAEKLTTTTAGATNKPVYFTNGVPTPISYEVNRTVPSNAVFTDTTEFTITANAADDDVVVLTGENGTNSVKYTASHAAKGPSAQYSSGNTVTSIGIGESKKIAIPQITVDTYGHTTAATDEEVSITIPSELPNPNGLTINGIGYDGSSAVEITLSDLGLASAMKFLGVTTSVLADGVATNPITIGGKSVTATAGNVVLYDYREFVWTGGAWEELGSESSYKIIQTPVSTPAASGNATAFIDSVEQDANGNITLSKKNVQFPTLSGGKAASADTSVVGGVTVDGHTVAVSSKTLQAGQGIGITGATSAITISNNGIRNITFAPHATLEGYFTYSANDGAITGDVQVAGLGDTGDGVHYFIDNLDNTIGYIDASGMHSTDFIIDNNTTLKGLAGESETLKTQLTSLDTNKMNKADGIYLLVEGEVSFG